MANLPASPYIESRNGGYYIAGTRIGLDVVVYDFRRGATAEDIFRSYPSIGSLSKIYGAITFILENPEGIEEYLKEQDELWEKLRREHPMPSEVLEELRRADDELDRKSA